MVMAVRIGGRISLSAPAFSSSSPDDEATEEFVQIEDKKRRRVGRNVTRRANSQRKGRIHTCGE